MDENIASDRITISAPKQTKLNDIENITKYLNLGYTFNRKQIC